MTMDLKMAMKRVFDDPGTFPEGWRVELAEIIRRCGGECYERKQKMVWMLTIRDDDGVETVSTSVYRTRAAAKAAMEEDIGETLANRRSGIHEDAELEREDELHAKLGGGLEWEITRETLWG